MKKKLIVLAGMVLTFAPFVAFAQALQTGQTDNSCTPGTSITNIGGVLCKVNELLNAIIPILVTLGIIYFIWGIVSYVIAGDEEAKSAGRDRIIYGVIGLAVIISVWGLAVILRNTFLGESANQQPIQLPGISVPTQVN